MKTNLIITIWEKKIQYLIKMKSIAVRKELDLYKSSLISSIEYYNNFVKPATMVLLIGDMVLRSMMEQNKNIKKMKKLKENVLKTISSQK